MKLTSKTDYCLRVLTYLQKNKSRVKIQQIADEYNVSKNHLGVVVNSLSHLGYIITTPGPHGGIEFNPKFLNHTVGDLIEEVEHLEIAECFSNSGTCSLKTDCKLKGMLKNATTTFIAELKKYKISELV